MAESISAEALNYLTMGIQAEISAYVFYKIGATKIGDGKAKETMLHFAGEERKHFLTLERHTTNMFAPRNGSLTATP